MSTKFKAELYVRIPTHMGRLFVPKALVNELKKKGNKYVIAVQLRTNDNSNRTYSNSVSIALSPSTQAQSMDAQEFTGMEER